MEKSRSMTQIPSYFTPEIEWGVEEIAPIQTDEIEYYEDLLRWAKLDDESPPETDPLVNSWLLDEPALEEESNTHEAEENINEGLNMSSLVPVVEPVFVAEHVDPAPSWNKRRRRTTPSRKRRIYIKQETVTDLKGAAAAVVQPKLDLEDVLVVTPISTHVPEMKTDQRNKEKGVFKIPEGWKVNITYRKTGKIGEEIKTYRDPEERYRAFRSVKTVRAYVEHGILPEAKSKSKASDGAAGKKRNVKRKKPVSQRSCLL